MNVIVTAVGDGKATPPEPTMVNQSEFPREWTHGVAI
jgi:hypothetical protein